MTKQGFYSFGRIKIISRTGARSAVATAAYHSGSEIPNDYDGVVHDYTKKSHVGETYIRMPESAPAEWQDESIPAKTRLALIWNHVEHEQSEANAQLARSNYIALPHSLTLEQGLECVDRFIAENCTSQGMGVTYSVHNQPGNLHVDVMYLMREYDSQGRAKIKSRKEYLCRNKDGLEAYMDAGALKKAEGYEKVYKYQKNGERKDLTPSEAGTDSGWERINKYPVCRTIKVSGWDDPDMATKWRKSWEDILNDKFNELGIDERVDCRSYEEQGINKIATVHEGWKPDKEEKKELNKEIKAYNKELDELYTEGNRAINSINIQIDDLKTNPQTETSIKEHEIKYNHNEYVVRSIVESDLLDKKLTSNLKAKLDVLRHNWINLINYFKERFKMRYRSSGEVKNLADTAKRANNEVHSTLDDLIKAAAGKSRERMKTSQNKNKEKGAR